MVTEKPIDFLYCFTQCKLVFGYYLIRAIVLEGRTADTEAVLECRETTKKEGSIVCKMLIISEVKFYFSLPSKGRMASFCR